MGCASPDADPTPALTPTASVATPPVESGAPTVSPTSPSLDAPTLGVVLDERHDFAAGARKVSTFNVTGGERSVVIFVESAGPPADRSFTSAVVDFYFPGSTSPFLGELPGQEAGNFTTEQQPHRGMWRVVYDGVGKTSVHVRVTLQ